jgi:hypothetical protein
MVQVSVSNEHGIKISDIGRIKLVEEFGRFPALEYSAVNKNSGVPGLDKKTGAGDLTAAGSQYLDLHGQGLMITST